jgi:hypothetical protein
MVEGIRTKSDEFKEPQEYLKAAGKERKKSTLAARRLIKKNDDLLKSRTDKFVRLFRKSNPAFCQDYMRARKSRTVKTEGAETA